MSYIYAEAESLFDLPTVGTSQCVALIQTFTKAGHTSTWKEGKAVRGDLSLAKGTAIATFVDGKYPNKGSGNHAAFYLNQEAGGVWVVDQWAGSKKVQKRRLSFHGTDKDRKYKNPSNNGDAFSVIE